MKKRLHDKKAGIAILVALIIISLVEIIFRATVIREAVLTTSNLGEQLAVVVLAATILILTAKGKDRACYICYGAWVAYFVLDQLFELFGHLISMISGISSATTAPEAVSYILGQGLLVLSSIGIIAIGVLLVEYMNDGTICNRAFNALCIATSAAILFSIVPPVLGAIADGVVEPWLGAFHGIYRLAMIFMFTFFAYDSAKNQLKKVKFSK